MSPAIGKALVKTMLRLRITAAAETAIRSGHPWVFAESIRGQNRQGRLGELAAIYDRKDCFLSIGLFDPGSPLRVRVLHASNPVTIDSAWWRERLRQAIARRDGLFGEQTTGYRWINGESDGWPGLVLDRYDTTLVLKLYTAAWLPRLKQVVGLIDSALPLLRRMDLASQNDRLQQRRLTENRRVVSASRMLAAGWCCGSAGTFRTQHRAGSTWPTGSGCSETGGTPGLLSWKADCGLRPMSCAGKRPVSFSISAKTDAQ